MKRHARELLHPCPSCLNDSPASAWHVDGIYHGKGVTGRRCPKCGVIEILCDESHDWEQVSEVLQQCRRCHIERLLPVGGAK